MRTARVAFQPAPMSGREMLPRMIAAENIGPIASACATAWMVVRFRLPSLPPALSPEPETLLMTHALLFVSLARFARDDIRFEHRMSTIEPLRVRSVVGLAYDEI